MLPLDHAAEVVESGGVHARGGRGGTVRGEAAAVVGAEREGEEGADGVCAPCRRPREAVKGLGGDRRAGAHAVEDAAGADHHAAGIGDLIARARSGGDLRGGATLHDERRAGGLVQRENGGAGLFGRGSACRRPPEC